MLADQAKTGGTPQQEKKDQDLKNEYFLGAFSAHWKMTRDQMCGSKNTASLYRPPSLNQVQRKHLVDIIACYCQSKEIGR